MFDNAWRLLFEGKAEAVAAFVTGESVENFSGARFLSAELPGTTLAVDGLIDTEGRRLHVELQLRAEAAKFEPRLVNYWARLNAMSEVPFEQHVIVLNSHGGRLSGLYRRGRLQLEYFVHHLWDIPVQALLEHETLFPLAVLGQASSLGERTAVLNDVIDKVEQAAALSLDDDDGSISDHVVRTIEVTLTLASIYLKPSIIESVLERNNKMTVLLRDLPLSQFLIEEGLEQGREQGLEQGREEAILTFARLRLGDLNERLAASLVDSSLGLEQLFELVLRAATQAELEQLLGG